MARKYGGLTGNKRETSQFQATGSWISPTEAARELSAAQWPQVASLEPQALVGQIVLAASSGTADNMVASSGYLRCDGSAVSRTTYSGLFAVLGTTYGPGNGSTTFNLPKYFDGHIYFKGAITSGTYPLGSGQLAASHSHNFSQDFYSFIGPFDRNPSEPGKAEGNNTYTTLTGSFDGEGIQNEVRKREQIPLIAVDDTIIQPGCAVAFLIPSFNPATTSLGPQYVIASGQALSRTAYSGLYQNLGNLYGSGNGSSTFNVPDYRGIFLSGPRQSITTQVSGSIAAPGYVPDCFAFHAHTFRVENTSYPPGGGGGTGRTRINAVAFSPASASNAGSSESRVDNISVIWALVVEPSNQP